MKYIRFEDGSINRDYEVGLLCPIHIVKESEKLEDLCDRFVIEYKDHNKQRILKTFMRVEMAFLKQQRYELHQIKAIYGAIWTDKGLIYVAKINDKGELELL